MSYENMTEAELDAALEKLGFCEKPEGLLKKARPRKGRSELARLLKAHPDRITKQITRDGCVSPEITLLVRLMIEEGYTAEMVEAIPPFRPTAEHT